MPEPTLKDTLEGTLKYTPDPNYDLSVFSSMDEKAVNSYMKKYPFSSFEDIPKDNSGLEYPSFEDIIFYPSKLIEDQGYNVVYVDGLAFIRTLGQSAFCIDPRRWHKIKHYISKGRVEYPECSELELSVMDGRHRTLLLMQIYNRKTIPIVIPKTTHNSSATYGL